MAYNNVTICLNGHIVSKNKAHSQNHCSKCGNKTYSSCTECNAPIRGPIKIEDVCILGEIPYTIPNYCYECGAPYPWTQKILDNAVELVSLDDDLDETSKELIISAIPELLVDTPTTLVAVSKYKKGISKAGQMVRDSMRQLLVDIVSETIKKSLFS